MMLTDSKFIFRNEIMKKNIRRTYNYIILTNSYFLMNVVRLWTRNNIIMFNSVMLTCYAL